MTTSAVTPERVLARHCVTLSGDADGPPIMFGHGYGCDQRIWRLVAPRFEAAHRVVLFDHLGAGRSDVREWSPGRYGDLRAYADDLREVCRALGMRGITFVGHSVSAMIGALAAIDDPGLFSRLVMVGPSPRYVDDDGYVGGFALDEVHELLHAIDTNHFRWSTAMAPVIMRNDDRPELADELARSFVSVDPEIAAHFARTTFLSDHRADLPRIPVPVLVMQSRDDVVAPVEIGAYVASAVPDARLVVMDAEGHCPHLSAPDETVRAIRDFLGER